MRYKNLSISLDHGHYDRLQEISIHQLSRTIDAPLFFQTDRAAITVFEDMAHSLRAEIVESPRTPWGNPAEIFKRDVDRQNMLHVAGLTAINLFNVSLFPKCNLAIYDEKFILKEYLGTPHHGHAMRWLRKQYSLLGLHFEITKSIPQPEKTYSRGIDFSVDIGDTNVFHWVGRVLPKIKFLRDYPSDWPIVFSYQPTEFQLDSLRLLGVTNPILIIDRHHISKFEKYIFLEGMWSSIHKGMMDYLRSNLLLPANNETVQVKKLYVFRGPTWTRELINRNEISTFLKSKGYTLHSLGGLGLVDTISLFRSVDELIFEHGAAGVFTMFTKPGAKILEIIPSRVHKSANEPTNFFFWLATVLGRPFEYIICENIRTEPWAEYSVELTLLKERMLSLRME
ncbi:glycosyltransferase family 61 protein [Polynucleobacter necessarius]|uniref:glycosyltransferase family 61 protein n=1 Tax=Polynucleobacter necessarius TaxID=576610 RepID=UPI000E09309C|nr:glycosyltransferase 61 family protein [Polynucleobacter necessarius]